MENITNEIIRHLEERKVFNLTVRNNPCLAAEDEFCIACVRAVVKSMYREDRKG